jgi:hypothetical protein
MLQRWVVEHLDVEKLLSGWRWLCPQRLALVARNAYGDLFLCDESGRIFLLNVGIGKFAEIADTEAEFIESANTPENREEWFAESDELAADAEGLTPGPHQCIGFSIPIVFAESGYPGNAYIADIYDCVGFLGDLHRQIAQLPDGERVELKIKR